jgi:DNA-binding transcriptional ArsR family regulator
VISIDASDIFRILADPTRRAVLDMLRTGEQNATELAARFAMSQQAVSLHLQELRKAGVVEVAREGRFRRYRLKARPLREVYEWSLKFKPLFDPYGHAWLMAQAPPRQKPNTGDSAKSSPRRKKWS